MENKGRSTVGDINDNDNVNIQKEHIDVALLSEWSDFLRKYQHDLQGPLRNIANFLQILKEELTKPEVIDKSATLKCINAAERCVYTLNSININQLIDNNNIIETFDLEMLLDPLHCLLLSQLNERRCRITIDHSIPHITGNKDEILRVFKNLIENSLNHAKTKNSLDVKITKLCHRGNRVMLQFSDNGRALTNRDRNKIRNSFASPASGISIVNSLLKKNNGYLQFVKSDVGCLWEIELPAVEKIQQKSNESNGLSILATARNVLMDRNPDLPKSSCLINQKSHSLASQKALNKEFLRGGKVMKVLKRETTD